MQPLFFFFRETQELGFKIVLKPSVGVGSHDLMRLTLMENCFRAQGGSESLCSPCSQEENEQREGQLRNLCTAEQGRRPGRGEGEWEAMTVAVAGSRETTLTGSESHGLTAQEGIVSCVWKRKVVQER